MAVLFLNIGLYDSLYAPIVISVRSSATKSFASVIIVSGFKG